jgi:hypothetical protein
LSLPMSTQFKNERSHQLILAAAAQFEAIPTMAVLNRLKINYTFIEIGIGAVNAGIIAGRLSALIVDRDVIFIGSCGQSSPLQDPYLVECESVSWQPGDVRQNHAYLIPGVEPILSLNSWGEASSLPKASISCSGAISLVKETRPAIFENLELYSVARSWQSAARSFRAVLGVTNEMGPDSHNQWKKNFGRVTIMTAEWLHDYLCRT